MQDLQAISGDADSSDPACTSQYAAVVTRTGPGVQTLTPGDRVVVMAPGYFATREHVAEWACHKLRENEDFNVRNYILYRIQRRTRKPTPFSPTGVTPRRR